MNAVRRQSHESAWPALLPVGYALAVTIYIALRYGYRWGEQDTGQFMESIRGVIAAGSIAPASGAYAHGYGYQTIAAFVAVVSGLTVSQVQLIVLPFLTLGIALIAFVAFRALIGNALLAGLAALLLFIQPEFLFVVERGNHEKITHSLVLVLAFLLAVSLTRPRTTGMVAGFILAFYLAAWALITTNSFFASSFMMSLALALVGGLITLWVSRSAAVERGAMRRLVYTVLSCLALFFVFVVYVYAPARHNFGQLQTLIEKLSVLFLSFEPQGNPYESVGSSTIAWAAPWVYPVLTAFNWLILVGSALAWVWLAVRFKREGLETGQRRLLLLWLLAAAFAFEVLVSVVVDFSGFLGANLQIRLFPLFMLFGIPLVIVAGAELAARITGRMARRAMTMAMVALLSVFAATGVLKATNDPLVSNKWLFFTSHEQQALVWADSQLERQEVWEGFDERLREMQKIYRPVDADRGNRFVINKADESTRYITMSEVIQRRSVRMNVPAPDISGSDRVYDNGSAQIFHRVPQTPYQP
ncbi:MAG TPA: hypothetical protein VFS96_03720 [Nitrolancea sp.]|nr:hypothetical protein [Nitrolancea sp.]